MKLFIIAIALALCGCAFDGQLQNRLACTVSKDKLFVVSEYGPIGVASAIADADRAAVCK